MSATTSTAGGHDDEKACGKLWEIYVNEAQRYDEGLVRSWKEDMDVILVFSGLYSAVLTAFVIESYQNLQEDPANVSATYRKHISQQLSGATNTTQPSEADFVPDASAFACNVLWFTSLTLALGCAFLATFVQQCTRRFLHRTTILRSATSRARLIQFLYFGLKDLGMHTIVDVIPSLLHLSLFSFFAGLVAFLHSVNGLLTYLMLAVLIVIASVYTTFTVLPLLKLNSSYHTPLSPRVWRYWGRSTFVFRGIMRTPRFSLNRLRALASPRLGALARTASDSEAATLPLASTIVGPMPPSFYPDRLGYAGKGPKALDEAMMSASQIANPSHEAISVLWTLRALDDDVELLPFVEALPDVLYGPSGLRPPNFHLIRPLLEASDPQSSIIERTYGLLVNSDQSWFSPTHQRRSRTACSKLLWTFAAVFLKYSHLFRFPHRDSRTNESHLLWVPLDLVKVLYRIHSTSNPEFPFTTSATAVCSLLIFHTCKTNLIDSENPAYIDAVQAILNDCPFPSWIEPFPYTTQKEPLFEMLSRRMSAELARYLHDATQTFPYEFDYTVSLFRFCGVEVYDFDAVNVHAALYLQLRKVAPDKEPGGDSHDDIARKVRQLDVIFEVAFSFVLSETGWADPSFYIAKRVAMDGWAATETIWTRNPSGYKHFYQTMGFLRHRISFHKNATVVFRELLFCLAPWPRLDDQATSFWASVLSSLRSYLRGRSSETVYKPACLCVAFCIRLMGEVEASVNPRPLDDLEGIIEYSRQDLASDPTIRRLAPAQVALGIDAHMHPLLLLQLLHKLDKGSSTPEIRDALLYYYHLETNYALPGSIEFLISTPSCAHDLACQTEEFTTQWISKPTPLALETLQIIWRIWASVTGQIYSPTEHAVLGSKLRPLIKAGNVILSLKSKEFIDRIKSSPGWTDSASKLSRFEIYADDFPYEVEWCQSSIRGILPYATPLPAVNDDDI